QITSGLGNGLIRLHGQFHGAFLEFCGIFFGRGLTHRTHLIRCMMSLFPCVRKSVATSELGPRGSSLRAPSALGVAPCRAGHGAWEVLTRCLFGSCLWLGGGALCAR